jgi:magnesium chelatase subunit I
VVSNAEQRALRNGDATLRERAGDLDTDEIVIWFDQGSALQVGDDIAIGVVRKGFDLVPGLVDTVTALGLAKKGDDAMIVVACELVLEALVARRKISRSDAGAYGRAEREQRRRPNQQDYFG